MPNAAVPVDVLAILAAGRPLAAEPWAMPAFFAGWVTVGLMLSVVLIVRGHERKTILALGVGLGPIMAVVVADHLRHRDRNVPPIVVAPGTPGPGSTDVVVVLTGPVEHLASIEEALQSLRADLRLLTVTVPLPFEALEEGDADVQVRAATRTLLEAQSHLNGDRPQLSVEAGSAQRIADRHRSRPGTVVLVTSTTSAVSDR